MKYDIQAVLNGGIKYRKASKNFNVPTTTLERRVRKARQDGLTANVAAKKKTIVLYTSFFQRDKRKN